MIVSMKKFIVALILLGVIVVSVFLGNQLEIDKCLDSGGAWNYEAEMCNK
jgi:hypothetical protein